MKDKKTPTMFVLCVQDDDKRIVDVLTGHKYDDLWMKGTALAKKKGRSWTVFTVDGRLVDTNFEAKNEHHDGGSRRGR